MSSNCRANKIAVKISDKVDSHQTHVRSDTHTVADSSLLFSHGRPFQQLHYDDDLLFSSCDFNYGPSS